MLVMWATTEIGPACRAGTSLEFYSGRVNLLHQMTDGETLPPGDCPLAAPPHRPLSMGPAQKWPCHLRRIDDGLIEDAISRGNTIRRSGGTGLS